MPRRNPVTDKRPGSARTLSWFLVLPLATVSTLVSTYWIFAYWMLTRGPPSTVLPLASHDAATGAPFITIILGHACMLAFWFALGALLLRRGRIFLAAYVCGAGIRATGWVFQSFNPDFPSEIGFFQIGLEATAVWLFLRWRQEANPPSLDT